MATSYTNHALAILSQLKSLIQAEFPELKMRQRYVERPYPKVSDFASEYTVRIKLIDDRNMGQYAGGRFDEWTLELYFTQIQSPDTDYAKLTAKAEQISAMLAANLQTSNWIYVTEDTNYDPDAIPQPALKEGELTRRIDGFIQTIKIQKGKF